MEKQELKQKVAFLIIVSVGEIVSNFSQDILKEADLPRILTTAILNSTAFGLGANGVFVLCQSMIDEFLDLNPPDSIFDENELAEKADKFINNYLNA